MVEILFLLLPFAFYSGWRTATRKLKSSQKKKEQLSDNFVKGVNYLLSEEPDKALEVFLNYPDIDEYTVETFHLLGNLFRERGEVDRALRVHQNVIARSNLNTSQIQKAMFALGQDFFAAGMLDRAESVFLELLESNNKTISKASICESLRTIYEQTQEWQKAIEATECSQKDLKTGNLGQQGTLINMGSLITHYYCELADEALQKGNLHEVDGLIAKADKAYNQSTRLMSLQGDIAFHQKQYKESLSFYLKAIQQDSRLISMLFSKLDESAKSSGEVQYLQKELLKTYHLNHDNNVFEAILNLAKKYGSDDEIDKLVNEVLKKQKLTIKSIYKASEYVKEKQSLESLGVNLAQSDLANIHQSLENHLVGVPSFRCEHCGYKMHDYLWRCPACNHWDTVDQA